MSLLPAWEQLPPLRRCYVRLLDPHGDVFDVWQNHLEAELEGLNEHHRVFRSNKEWQAFLDSQRAIATEWDLRNTLTKSDQRFLDSLKISWGQPPLSLTIEQLMEAATQTVKQMSPEEKATLRQQLGRSKPRRRRRIQKMIPIRLRAWTSGMGKVKQEDRGSNDWRILQTN